MATSTWTSQIELTVAADEESVIRWYMDAKRRLEFRAHLETPNVSDFEYHEHTDDGLRIVEITYISRTNLRILYRSTGQITTPGTAEINATGNRVLRKEVYQHRVHPGGKEDVSKAKWNWEFISEAPHTTRLRVSTEDCREGATWWEKYLPPIADRQHRRKELKEQADRCARDLGVN